MIYGSLLFCRMSGFGILRYLMRGSLLCFHQISEKDMKQLNYQSFYNGYEAMWTTELGKMTTEVWKRMGTDHAIKVIWKIANVKLRKKDFKNMQFFACRWLSIVVGVRKTDLLNYEFDYNSMMKQASLHTIASWKWLIVVDICRHSTFWSSLHNLSLCC